MACLQIRYEQIVCIKIVTNGAMLLLFLSHACLRLKEDAMLTVAPPCSLYIGACQNVHKRTHSNPEGNQRNYCVRLSRRIWLNMATRIPCWTRAQILYHFVAFFHRIWFGFFPRELRPNHFVGFSTMHAQQGHWAAARVGCQTIGGCAAGATCRQLGVQATIYGCSVGCL